MNYMYFIHLFSSLLSLSLSLSSSLPPLLPSLPPSQLGLSSQSDSNDGSADSVATPTGPSTPSAAFLASTDEPIHIINVAIKNENSSSDEELVKKCYDFVQVW